MIGMPSTVIADGQVDDTDCRTSLSGRVPGSSEPMVQNSGPFLSAHHRHLLDLPRSCSSLDLLIWQCPQSFSVPQTSSHPRVLSSFR